MEVFLYSDKIERFTVPILFIIDSERKYRFPNENDDFLSWIGVFHDVSLKYALIPTEQQLSVDNALHIILTGMIFRSCKHKTDADNEAVVDFPLRKVLKIDIFPVCKWI